MSFWDKIIYEGPAIIRQGVEDLVDGVKESGPTIAKVVTKKVAKESLKATVPVAKNVIDKKFK